MAVINTLSKLASSLLVTLLFLQTAYAGDNTCPGSGKATLSSANTSYTKKFTVKGNKDPNDYIYFNIAETGTVTIQMLDTEGRNYYFSVSKTSCGGTDIYGRTRAKTHQGGSLTNIPVQSGDRIYVRIDAVGFGDNKKRGGNFSITWKKKADPRETCPGELLSTLDGTLVSATETRNGVTVPANTTYYYHFTPNAKGTIQVTSQANKISNSLYIYDGCGGTTLWSATNNSKNKSSPAISVNAGQQIVIAYKRRYTTSINVDFTFVYTVLVNHPPTISGIPDSTGYIGTSFTLNTSNYANDPDGDALTYSATGLPGGLSIDPSTGVISGTPSATGASTVTVTVSDGEFSASDTFVLTVTYPPAVATDDYYTTPINSILSVNTTNGLLSNDSGYQIRIVGVDTTSLQGTLTYNASTGEFTYKPPLNYTGTTTFTYTIQDSQGNTATATVHITVNTKTTTGRFLPFEIINPPYSRNVIGGYAIAGNTMFCLTEKTSGYGGTCHGDDPNYATITSNLHVVKYLDIDNNTSTWNSTSSYINLPNTFNPDVGIIWAGLFWQGRISWDTNYNIRYAKENSGGGFQYVEVGKGTNVNNVDLINATANLLRLKVDNGDYQQVRAARFHTYESSNGKTYAAFADVTAIVHNQIKTGGKHVFTVANLVAGEGREPSPGLFGGWSLVVIYGEEYTVGKPRNISIYNGFISMGTNDTPIQISGFRLPRSGTVSAQLSVFSGEGEYLYGRTPWSNSQDWMKISDKANTNFQYLPGVPAGRQLPNRDNMFDAHLDGILRDKIAGKSNDQSVNNVGIDVDNYDVSDIMSSYRDSNPNVNTVYIKTYSNNDYITPSMIAFSAELFTPSVCYDYVVKRNEFLIPSKNQHYETYAQKDDKISFTVAIWDIKGDIDPRYVSVAVNLRNQTEGRLSAIRSPKDKAYYSITNSNTLLPTNYADPYTTPTRPVITIGKGRTDSVGGTISPDEIYYTKYYFNVDEANSSLIAGNFTIEVNATLNYGSGDFWQILNIQRCPQNEVYSPTWYQFNIERAFTTNEPAANEYTRRYSLPTRVAGQDFDYSVASYTQDANGEYTVPNGVKGVTIDVELINIDAFDDNGSVLKCGNSEPSIIMMPGNFVYFDTNTSRKNVIDANDLANMTAARSATFRMWLLLDDNGTILSDGNYHPKNDNAYYGQLYNTYFRANDTLGLCNAACTSPYAYRSPRFDAGDTTAVGCYACLRDFFAKPVCARDNFSIRPKAFKVEVLDRGVEGNATSSRIVATNKAGGAPDNNVTIVAEYPYELNITTVDYNDNFIKGYYSQKFTAKDPLNTPPSKYGTAAYLAFNDDTTACRDTDSKSLKVTIDAGRSFNTQLQHDNAGKYTFEIWDGNWTTVDRAYLNPNKTIFDPNCKESIAAQCNDCILDNTQATRDANEKVGCVFGSRLDDASGNPLTDYAMMDITFMPYRFTINPANLLTYPNDTHTWVYMNDLTKDQNVSAVIEANITAVSAAGNALSNYVLNCAAKDVMLWLDRNMTAPGESALTTEKGTPVAFQQWLSSQYETQPVEDNRGNGDMNATLSSLNFRQENNGTAGIKLYYNFRKPYSEIVNAVRVTFNTLFADAPAAAAEADMTAGRIPDGNVSIDDNRTFLFAKVAPKLGDEYVVTYDESYTTYIRADVFCKDTVDFLCATLPGIGDAEETEGNGLWYRAREHNSTNGDGRILNLTTSPATGISEIPMTNVAIDNNGSTGDLIFTYPLTQPRDKTFVFTIAPDEWLKYDQNSSKNGLPTFTIEYQNQNLRWKGSGKTGFVIETEPTLRSQNKPRRLNW